MVDSSGRIDSLEERVSIVKSLSDRLSLHAVGWNLIRIQNACEWPWNDALEVIFAPHQVEIAILTPFYLHFNCI